jgi:hypothetical protein
MQLKPGCKKEGNVSVGELDLKLFCCNFTFNQPP